MRKWLMGMSLWAGVGCGGEPVGVEETPELETPGKADTLHPMDNSLGTLRLTLPALPAGSRFENDTVYSYRGKAVQPGVNQFTSGDGNFVLGDLTLGARQEGNVSIGVGQSTDIMPSALRIRAETNVDFGPPLMASLKFGRHNLPFRSAVGGRPDTFTQLVAGSYIVNTSIDNHPVIPGKDLTLAPGEVRDLDLPDLRASVTIHTPTREFPDAPCGERKHPRHFIFLSSRAKAWEEDKIHRYESSVVSGFPAARETESRGFMSYPGEGAFLNLIPTDGRIVRFLAVQESADAVRIDNRGYTYRVNGTQQQLNLGPGDNADVYLKRIDVDDVLVTRLDGTTYTVPGTYTIGVDATSCPLSDLPTKTGVDVLPGVYRIVVKHKTETGESREATYTMDLTH